MIRSPQFPVAQVVRRISELENATCSKNTRNSSKLIKTHSEGPVPQYILGPVDQYKEIHLANFCIKVSTGDNCIRGNGRVGIVLNVIVIEGDPYLVYNEFTCASSFFDYPMDSCQFGVFLLTDLSQDLKCVKMDDNVSKYVLLPFRNTFVGMPFRHLL